MAHHGQNPQYFKHGLAVFLSLHIPQKVLSVLQSRLGLSWQGGVVVPKLDEAALDNVVGVVNKLVGDEWIVFDEIADNVTFAPDTEEAGKEDGVLAVVEESELAA